MVGADYFEKQLEDSEKSDENDIEKKFLRSSECEKWKNEFEN